MYPVISLLLIVNMRFGFINKFIACKLFILIFGSILEKNTEKVNNKKQINFLMNEFDE